MKKIYEGYLKLDSDSEGDDILFLDEFDCPLADQIKDDIREYGKYLNVRYFISPKEETLEGLEDILIKNLTGISLIEYGHAYSEYTGYLWTDEIIQIGGHDLLKELKDNIGQYLFLIIEYHKE